MSLEVAKLRWRCRRGMKELDLLLLSYLERRYDAASEEERWIFSELLELPDPKLHAYLLGREQPAVHAIADVVRAIRHAVDRRTRAGWLTSMLSMKLSTGFAEDRRTLDWIGQGPRSRSERDAAPTSDPGPGRGPSSDLVHDHLQREKPR